MKIKTSETTECAALLDFVIKHRITNLSWQPSSKAAQKYNVNEDAIIEMLSAQELNKGTQQTPIFGKLCFKKRLRGNPFIKSARVRGIIIIIIKSSVAKLNSVSSNVSRKVLTKIAS